VCFTGTGLEINVLWPVEPPLKCPQYTDVGEIAASARGYAEIFSYVGNHWKKNPFSFTVHVLENGRLK
jgi:hypothetical protein